MNNKIISLETLQRLSDMEKDNLYAEGFRLDTNPGVTIQSAGPITDEAIGTAGGVLLAAGLLFLLAFALRGYRR